jgi:hypothetical protein
MAWILALRKVCKSPSFRRKPESRGVKTRNKSTPDWIPASAGMTPVALLQTFLNGHGYLSKAMSVDSKLYMNAVDALSNARSAADFLHGIRTEVRSVLPHGTFLGVLRSPASAGRPGTSVLSANLPENYLHAIRACRMATAPSLHWSGS